MPLIPVFTLIPISYGSNSHLIVLTSSALRALMVLPIWPPPDWVRWPSVGVASATAVLVACAAAAARRYAGRWRAQRSSDKVRAARAR
jgi:hypothetical protein